MMHLAFFPDGSNAMYDKCVALQTGFNMAERQR